MASQGTKGGGRAVQTQRPQQGGRMTVQQERENKKGELTGMIEALTPDLSQVAAKGIDLTKMKRVAITAVQNNPDLLDCTADSWIKALMHCVQDGLMPDGREAAFVKFGGDVQYMPMAYGIRKKIRQSGEVSTLFTAIVYQAEVDAGRFKVLMGTEQSIYHEPILGSADLGEIVAAYSVAKLKDGETSFEVMTAAEIKRVQAVSKTGTKADSPWGKWWGEMARKTALRRHAKSLPMSSDYRDVEVETMFDRNVLDRALQDRTDSQKFIAGSGPKGELIEADTTRQQTEDIERRATGAQAQVPDDDTGGEQLADQRGDHTAGTDDDGVDWEKWFRDFRAAIVNAPLKALKTWKKPEGIPDEVLADAELILEAEIKAKEAPAKPEQEQEQSQPSSGFDVEAQASEQTPAQDVDDGLADELVEEISRIEFTMDLRSWPTKRADELAKLSRDDRKRVDAAYDERFGKLQVKP